MHPAIFVSLFLLALSMKIFAQTHVEFSEMWEKDHVSNKLPSNVRHKDLKTYLEQLKKSGIKVDEVGRSVANREIYQAEFGRGPLKVFLWSQMHGDEPTATSAVIDLLAILQKHRGKDWVKNIEKTMTIRVVPMLNPDGSEAYTRRNMQGLDINRDAQHLKSPEAQLLKKLRDEWSPHIGFNLHNQNALTTAGQTYKQAAISFLVVFGDAQKTSSEGHERNKRLAATMTHAIQNYILGSIGRYDDEYTPSAFGDSFSAWGTPVILIETGALHGQSEMFLVKLNFIAIATALKALADGSEKNASPIVYEQLPCNTSGRLFYFVFRNVSLVDRTKPNEVTITDIGANTERRRAEFTAPTIVSKVRDLSVFAGLEEFDASSFYAVGRYQDLTPGSFAEILFYRKDRQIDWTAAYIEKNFPPDAIFSLGKWIKGAGVVPKK
ncbi:MAG: M14 family zinc carboxypeptidase [Pyrinomonadaceae bacterium]